MTAIVLPDIDRSTVEELRKKIPNLAEFELPTLPKMENLGKNAGKTADQTIDRLLGRSRAPVWPWIAVGIGLVAAIGAFAAWITWFRRPTWEASRDTWSSDPTATELGTSPTAETIDRPVSGTGLSAAESSLTSNPYPVEEA